MKHLEEWFGRVPASISKGATVSLQDITLNIACLPIVFVNVYFVGEPGGPWILVDSGLPGFAGRILKGATQRFGDRAPTAIFLTHGHFDHASAARTLAEEWDVPIYAHALEMPYLTGRSAYPPPDPTVGGCWPHVGGCLSQMSRTMPHSALDLGPRLQTLPEGGELPGAEGWRWVHTPGHSPGHVSMWNEESRALLAGDAVATANLDSCLGAATMRPKLWRAGTPFNYDWNATRHSVRQLAALRPETLACGHGQPFSGPNVATEFAQFATSFPMPSQGRYVSEPAVADESGVAQLPSAPPDPVRSVALSAVSIGVTFYFLRRLLSMRSVSA
jgi:glyoxylase-like metal-dependent hydrolase (beta-lactamase superfamily II)